MAVAADHGAVPAELNVFHPDPDRVDVTRFGGTKPVRRHLAFSQGQHFCLGAPLARLASGIVFERLLRRAPDFALLTDEPTYRPHVSMRGPAELPIRLRAG